MADQNDLVAISPDNWISDRQKINSSYLSALPKSLFVFLFQLNINQKSVQAWRINKDTPGSWAFRSTQGRLWSTCLGLLKALKNAAHSIDESTSCFNLLGVTSVQNLLSWPAHSRTDEGLPGRVGSFCPCTCTKQCLWFHLRMGSSRIIWFWPD